LKSFRHRHSSGFSIIEALVAIFLVAIAVASLIAASGSLTQVNAAGVELSTAEFLIEQIRELTDLLPGTDPDYLPNMTFAVGADYDDVDDFDNFDSSSLGAPITSDWQPLNEFSAYTQKVTVERVSESDLEQVVYDNTTHFIRVTVTITLNGEEISSARWIRARKY
jgi:Tfp pilus assembly protein PilV